MAMNRIVARLATLSGAIALSFCMTATVGAQAAPATPSTGKPRVSVLPFTAEAGVATGEARAISLAFEASLHNLGLYQLIAQSDVDAILKTQEAQLGGLVDEQFGVAVGKLIGAQWIVLGSVAKVGATFVLTIKMVDVEKGAIAAATTEYAPRVDDFLPLLGKLSASLAGVKQAAAPLAPSIPVAPAAPAPAASASATPTPAGKTVMVAIPAGSFTMGSPWGESGREDDEGPQSKVTLSAFLMCPHEVTQAEWLAVMGDQPSAYEGDDLPVENVSWFDAVEYCNKLSAIEGLTPAYVISGKNVSLVKGANGYRLPTEAEWEYACRAGSTGPFAFGKSLSSEDANFDGTHPYGGAAKGEFLEETTPVESYEPNAWGLYDMHGNVWEWCWDWYDEYSSMAKNDPFGPSSGDGRVMRGGSCFAEGAYLRSAVRDHDEPDNCYDDVGFRVVRRR